MLKFWVCVFFGAVQIALVFGFIFPDDDYFKHTKPPPTPRYRNNHGPRHTTSPPTQSTTNNVVQTIIFKSCIAACPTTPEYDPICATNRISYPNKSTLSCMNRCGLDVRMVRLGRCKPFG